MRWTTERKTQGGFAFALACVLLISAVSLLSLRQLTNDNEWVARAVEVMANLQQLQTSITLAESNERDFLITDNPVDLRGYRAADGEMQRAYGTLRRLSAATALEQGRLTRLAPLLAARFAEFARLIDLRREHGFASAQAAQVHARNSRHVAEQIKRLIGQIRARERGQLARREAQTRHRTLLTEGTVAGGGALAFLVSTFALLAIRRDFAGRQRAEGALRELNADLENRVVQRTEELARVNASLRSSERRFRAFVNMTSDVVYEITPDWSELRPQRGDGAAADAPGVKRDELDQLIHPDDRALVHAAVERAISSGEVFELEHRVRRSDGRTGWAFSRAIPLKDDSGRVVEWFGAASDITERRDTQAKLETQLARLSLLGNITRAMGERQDVRSIFQVVIRTLEAHLSLDFCSISLYEEGDNRLTVTHVGAQSRPLALELAMDEQARINIDQNGLSRCVRGELVYEPNLAQIPFPFARRLAGAGLGALVAAPLRFESRVFGVLLAARRTPESFSSGESEFLRQLSEHVALAAHQTHLYQALQHAYDDLRQTQQVALQHERLLALGTMASGIAHDINNAISPIMLYTDMLLEDRQLPGTVLKSLQVIQRAVEQVAHTVARMREFYRPREPQQQLLPVDLNQLVQQVLDLTRARWSDMPQRRGAQIELDTALASSLPPVAGVATELRDALTNLVFNAVDAMPQGGRLSLRSRLIDAHVDGSGTSGFVQLEVADTGYGMDEETRSRCLEPFFTTKGERGTGLGLPMVYGTMQRHSGEIEVDSAPGKGTRVTLSFPITLDGRGNETGARPLQVVSSRRILLVDDDPIVIQSTREALAADGHAVTVADGGQAGIEAFRASVAAGNPFPVVITDLGMPQVDGRQVASAVKATHPDTLVVMLTGWGRRLVEEGEVPANIDRVLTKPARLRELREALALRPDLPRN